MWFLGQATKRTASTWLSEFTSSRGSRSPGYVISQTALCRGPHTERNSGASHVSEPPCNWSSSSTQAVRDSSPCADKPSPLCPSESLTRRNQEKINPYCCFEPRTWVICYTTKDDGETDLPSLPTGALNPGSVWQGWGGGMSALKDSFVGKGGLPSCEEHASAFITTDGLFLGLEKVNYESKVTILLKLLKMPCYKTSNKL